MRWRLTIEEHGPDLQCIKGTHDVVADASSRLSLKPAPASESDHTVIDEVDSRPLSEAFGLAEMHRERMTPVRHKTLMSEQQADRALMKAVNKPDSPHRLHTFHGGENKNRWPHCLNGKTTVPQSLQQCMVLTSELKYRRIPV